MKRRLLDPLLIRTEIVDVGQVRPRMRHIRLRGPQTQGLAWKPGQQVRVQVAGLPAAVDWLTGQRRTYSIWDYDGTSVELCVLDHGEGPGARWARSAKVGDEVLISKPQGDFTLRPAAHHLFVGEETASVAFGPMLRAVPASEPALVVVEVGYDTDALPLPGEVHWHYREGASAAASAGLVDAVRKLTLPDEPGVAYLAGEARTVQAVRQHLVAERGWPRRGVLTKPFWTPGKTGLE